MEVGSGGEGVRDSSLWGDTLGTIHVDSGGRDELLESSLCDSWCSRGAQGNDVR